MFAFNTPAHWFERAMRVTLIGCGGTGSEMLMRLAKLDRAVRALGHREGISVTVYDDDRVSEANLARQPFARADVGAAKADVLVQRLNLFYGLDWKAKVERITASSTLWDTDLVIGCVDTRKARQAISIATSRLSTSKGGYYLDCGNTNHTAQYVLGSVNLKPDNAGYLPQAGVLFPDLLDPTLDDKDDGPSCSLAEALEKQSLFINSAVADGAASLLYQLLTNGGANHHGGFIDVANGMAMPLKVDWEAWKRMGVKRPRKSKATAS